MKNFYRTSVSPAAALAEADAFFPTIGMKQTAATVHSRKFSGVVGEPDVTVSLELTAKMEGGHYTFVKAQTTAQGESRLDRGVKKYFMRLHKMAEPRYALSASY